MANVLEGSVRKSGNRVRISVQLIDVAEGNNLWSERYDRDDGCVRDPGRDIAGDRGQTEGETRQPIRRFGTDAPRPAVPLVKRYTENLEAYNLYLKGRYELYKMTREGLDASRASVRRSDPARSSIRAGARRSVVRLVSRRLSWIRRAERGDAEGQGGSTPRDRNWMSVAEAHTPRWE